MMMQQIKLFLFVLSIIYTLRFIVELVIRLFQDNPDSISIKKYEQYIQYFTLSYIITYLLT
jgi:Na+-driven multidrug efflux pump